MADEQRKVKVFGTDSDLKALGELTSNKTSRKIIYHLMKKEMYTNEISNTLEIRVSVVIHHLTKMNELGLLEVTNKKITRKGKEHRFFKMKSNIFIIPDATRAEIKEKGLLKKIFRDGIHFTAVMISGLVSWSLFKKFKPLDPDVIYYNFTEEDGLIFNGIDFYQFVPILIANMVVIILTYVVIKKRKGN